MKKIFITWCISLFLLTLLSLLWPPLAIIALIILLVKLKSFTALFEKYEAISNADEYVIQKKNEAEVNYFQRTNDADIYYATKKESADNYYEATTQKAYAALGDIDANKEKAKQEIEKLEIQKNNIISEIDELTKESIVIATNFIVDDEITSEEYKNKLAVLNSKMAELIKNEEALLVNSNENKKVIRDNSKQILRCFESESTGIIKAVTTKNIDAQRNKLNKCFDNINKIFEVDGMKLNFPFLEYKLEELNLTYAFQLKKEQEKEEQKAIREQILEEEKVRREIDREKAKIEKEETQFKNEITKLMGYLQKSTDVEKQLYLDKIKELEEKLKLVEKDKENVLEREQNTRAGYVYIISNIGSFGEDIYKIGMTRRLEPMDRVKELGDASVPFEFDVHAMIFSEDAPALENTLHATFRNNQVNKVNARKEFFEVSLAEIEKVVKQNHNATVEFTHIAKAEQYRESLRLSQVSGL
ncbi:DUF4041 domain-containing protein [Anaerotignum sp. MB30-C6]|uniref:DUF4041 domain-containing protein n=1 Tax=Anaerotignum sp. MB30-C6 TaxID=3070814 RepID=UPI0027DAF998|nr:DUF4041 domain-containing protein [Anaerotignum sp. MB30-C6]WMI80953.1 DUF4041 domain-containing protein [Anaerotignum sp. MB30-C6]